MKIAILEDDVTLAQDVADLLKKSGHFPRIYSDGEELISALATESYDLFVIDWYVPKVNGLGVLKYIRNRLHSKSPVLFLSGNANENATVMALKWGADDYCKKPILAKEFIARVTALGRRIGTNLSQSTQAVVICGYSLNPAKHTVEIDGKVITLSEMEFKLAHYLFLHLNSPIARATLLNEVWGRTDAEMTRTLDVHMTWIRKKLSIGASGQILRLSAIYGYGYRLSEIFPSYPT